MKYITRNIFSVAAIIGLFLALTFVEGCSKSEPQGAKVEPRPTPPTEPAPGQHPKLANETSQSIADSLGLNLPDMKIPTQEEMDALITSKIDAGNADAEFTALQKEIDSDGG